MIKKLISIIVPVYNVEKYLDNCIQSVINQTYEDIELILVDDGSTDKSGEICDKYSKNKNTIIIHKANTGVSDTRNIGIENANGEFIMFLDSDDFLHPLACELLYNKILEDGSDVVFARYKIVNPNDYKLLDNFKIENSLSCIKNRKQALRLILNLDYPEGVNAIAKLYKAELLLDKGFMVGYPLGEDQEFIFSVVENCELITFFDVIIYFYVYRENSAGHKEVNISNEIKLHELYDYILKKHNYLMIEKENTFLFACVQSNLNSLNKMIICGSYDQEFVDFLIMDLKNKSKVFLKARGYTLKKIQLLFAAYFWRIYKPLFLLLKR